MKGKEEGREMEVLQGLLLDSLHPLDNNVRNSAQEKLVALSQNTPELSLALLVRNPPWRNIFNHILLGVCCQPTTRIRHPFHCDKLCEEICIAALEDTRGQVGHGEYLKMAHKLGTQYSRGTHTYTNEIKAP